MPHGTKSLLSLVANLLTLTKNGSLSFSKQRSARSQRSARFSASSRLSSAMALTSIIHVIRLRPWRITKTWFLHYSSRLWNRTWWSSINWTSQIVCSVDTWDSTFNFLSSVPILWKRWISILILIWCLSNSVSWINCIRVELSLSLSLSVVNWLLLVSGRHYSNSVALSRLLLLSINWRLLISYKCLLF